MDPIAPEPPPTRPNLQGQPRKNLTSEQTREIVSTLVWELKDSTVEGKFRRGVVSAVANTFHVHESTIRRIWARALANFQDPEVRAFRASPQKKRCGRKKKWNHDEVREAVKEVPLHHKRTLRDLAAYMGMPLTMLFRMKRGLDRVIMPFSSSLKPALTEIHKVGRVLYSVSKLDPVDLHYNDMYNSVHVDEKWFFVSEKVLRLYIATDETVPHRTCQNKDHIIKVMFLTAVARPRFDEDGVCTFDGKIGMFPFVDYIPAQRASRNRPRGAIVTTPFSVTKNRYREFMVTKVIPAIKEKWPDRNRNIIIQQDGAPAHIAENDAEFVAAARTGLWNIKLELQPPKSPDVNVLDLSFFRALQAAQWKRVPTRTIDGLIQQEVNEAFAEFNPRKIDFGFLTLQCCMDDILTAYGNNDYKIRHMGKNALLQQGQLPTRIAATETALHVFNMFRDDNRNQVAAGDDDAAGENDARLPVQMIQFEAV
ncbi:hypothetical protein MHU86_6914 [Fragilaria crotonensis]|nr:hypothetical protein MHU86_6914 [Fragilaria crotonensis]